MKKLIPATVMLLVAAVLMSTASFAWFSMNTQVTATAMQVRAVAEDGILIINELDDDIAANWKASTNASYGSIVDLAPTSTADVAAWYHNSSDDQNTAKADQIATSYDQISDTSNFNWKRDEGSGKSGTYYIDDDNNDSKETTEKAYVLLNKFFIKSSGNAIALGTGETYSDLYVNKIVVGATSTSAALDASLRVAVKVGSTVTIYAPVSGATTTYHVAGYTLTNAGEPDTAANRTFANEVVAVVPAATTGIVNTAQNQSTIPAIGTAKASTVEADVFIYFEGEDAGLKSANLASTLDTLTVEVVFGITQLPTT